MIVSIPPKTTNGCARRVKQATGDLRAVIEKNHHKDRPLSDKDALALAADLFLTMQVVLDSVIDKKGDDK